MAATLLSSLTLEDGTPSKGFLNDLVKQLWPNIAVATARSIKQITEAMFPTMLPAPLNTLYYEKIDLGNVPMHLENIDVHTTENGGIGLDMDVDWDGVCDIELNGKMVPKIGVEHIKLRGRLSVLLCPITDVFPLVGALQIAFINKPYIKLTFTDAASIAGLGAIDRAIRNCILGVISSMAVLPNRFLVKLDATNDYFKTYQHPLGVIRLTVESGANFGEEKHTKNFLKKLVHDTPDCYVLVNAAGEPEWRTKTVKNDRHPEWNQQSDFMVASLDQAIEFDVNDSDTAADDDIGVASTTVKELLRSGGRQELTLFHNEAETPGKLTVAGKFFSFVPDAASLSDSSPGTVGLLSVLIASVLGIPGKRDELKPSVRVTWGDKTLRTVIKTDAPGADMENPSFDQAFKIPITAGMVPGAPVRIALLNGEEEMGAVEVPLDDVLAAPGLALQKGFEVGSGVTIRAGLWLRGVKAAE